MKLNFPYDKCICYSGYRNGQAPGVKSPDYEQVKEDLLLLHNHWRYLRLYDCDELSQTVLSVIRNEGLNFKVMQGAFILAEMNNFGCPWGGTNSEEVLISNKKINNERIDKLIEFANKYPDIIFSVSAGNEACAEWTDHYVSENNVIEYVRRLKANVNQPVTFCDNYVPWITKLKNLAEEVDFISIHTYPVWEYKNLHDAMEYTRQNYNSVAELYPNKTVIITEAGWATNSNGKGINPDSVSEENQASYVSDLLKWSKEKNVLTFVFEAFDEPWKGSPEPLEPEKHWGLYNVDRSPKLLIKRNNT